MWALLGNGEVIDTFATEVDAWSYACEYSTDGYGYLEVGWFRAYPPCVD